MSDDKIPQRAYGVSIGGGLTAFMAFRWASTIVQEWGQKPSQHVGTVLGIAVCFAAALLLADYMLWRWRLIKAIRSGLWASAAIGPFAGLVAAAEWEHPVWSHVIGAASAILAFVVFYSLEQRLDGRQDHVAGPER